MAQPGPLTQLAQGILQYAEDLDAFYASNNLPSPSFSADAPQSFSADITTHPEIHKARHSLIDATKDLRDLIIGPRDTLKWMIMNDHTLAASLHVISHFNVAQAVPVAGSISFVELAEKVGLSELDVARFVRRTAINRIFVEVQPGYVAHTAISALLATDEQMQALVAHMSEEAFPASARIMDALEISKTNNSATGVANESPSPFALAFGSSFFERKAAQPETLQRFGLAMSSWSSGDGAHQMVTCYDWGYLPAGAKIVDVGGALGHISLAIAEAFPGLTFLVEDQAPLTQQADELIASHSEAVSGRVKFLPWNFFQPQPEEAQGADVYILRYILHDWADENAKKIFANILNAAGPKSRVLIADAVMPPPGVLPRCQEEVLRSFDVSMLAQLNSQERTLDMWESLVGKAGDGRWRILNVIPPPKGESITILEVGHLKACHHGTDPVISNQTKESPLDLVESRRAVGLMAYSGKVETRSVETGEVVQIHSRRTPYVGDLALSPNGQYLAIVSVGDIITIRQVQTDILQQAVRGASRKIDFGDDGSTIITNKARIALDWSLPQGSSANANWQGYGVDRKGEWVTWNGRRLLRLPAECSYGESAVTDQILVRPYEATRIIILEFAEGVNPFRGR
ncbi:S-adenosyl-L-methionine-dependent methyltransferase [Aspergillus germanicus]